MSKKNYNVFFNLHTVSGIVISVALYIIFLAGSFCFFRSEIDFWQKGEVLNKTSLDEIDTDAIFKNIDEEYNLLGRDVSVRFRKNRNYVRLDIGDVKDTLIKPNAKEGNYIPYYDIKKNKIHKTDRFEMGDFLYHLHYLRVIPYIGVELVGLVAIFFLFAMISGVVVHWKKIVSNFYAFNPKVILKKIWTDAHTALGILGLPFQFIYATTGAFLGIKLLMLLPSLTLFNNDTKLLFSEMSPEHSVEWQMKSNNERLAIHPFINKSQTYWKGFNVKTIKIYNYGGTNMSYKVSGSYDSETHFFREASIIYNAYSGEIVQETNIKAANYVEDTLTLGIRLHEGSFGGLPIKLVYFIFGILTCFVIITGVLIWIEARNKKSMTLKQRKYTARVGHIYLAICLSMLPVTALFFVFGKITYGTFENPKSAIYSFYLITWLLFTLFYSLKKDNYFTNKNSLLLGAIFGFLVPIVNGITSGNWFWKMYFTEQYEIFMVDILWIVLSSICLLFYVKIKPSIKEKSSFTINPIEG